MCKQIQQQGIYQPHGRKASDSHCCRLIGPQNSLEAPGHISEHLGDPSHLLPPGWPRSEVMGLGPGGSVSTSLVITLGPLPLGQQPMLAAPQVPQSFHFLSQMPAQKVLWTREISVIFQIFTAVFIKPAQAACHCLILLEFLQSFLSQITVWILSSQQSAGHYQSFQGSQLHPQMAVS